jgi:hypothetical protein
MLRPFGWRDLPTLYRYRHQGIFLDSALWLTRGSALIPGFFFSGFSAATGLITWICADECDELPLVGQLYHPTASPAARLTFLAPQEAQQSSSIQQLLEQLARQAGQHGAFHLQAEAEADSAVFDTLRRSGFSAYTRQRIWRYNARLPSEKASLLWRAARPIDRVPVTSLYRQVVPDIVRNIESLKSQPLSGMVFSDGTEFLAYAEIKYGGRGIWVKPVIKPDIEQADQLVEALLRSIPERRARPIFLCVRAYQPHLEPALEALGAEPGTRQIALVKHLAVHHKLRESFALPNLEGRSEASAPLAQTRRNL